MVRDVIHDVRPRWILIEGPADMNPRLGELALDHHPPIALFCFHFAEDRRHSSWYPFCVHSPEWLALRHGFETGAEVRFIDLPGWAVTDDDEEEPENRYADRRGPPEYIERLERLTGEHGYDAIWDGCFELPVAPDLSARLAEYFDGLRSVEAARPSDLQREAFMGDYVAWADAQDGDAVVVCGGFHAPALREAVAQSIDSEPQPPVPDANTRAATWLVPYSEKRLDSFAGYASGLPSPAWYRWSWERDNPARCALKEAVGRLRKRGMNVSAADTVAAWTQAEALARLRGHPVVARVDLLDAVASTWIKEALDAPLPWSSRQALQPGTHPVVVELVAALSGSSRGRLATDTPLPPLVGHVQSVLEELDLRMPDEGSRAVSIFSGETDTKPRLLALERLLLLGITGFRRTSPLQASPQEFRIAYDESFESSLLEAASYGPTLEAAAVACLEEMATEAKDFVSLVNLLVASVRAGLPAMSGRAIEQLRVVTGEERSFDALGRGLGSLVGMLRHAGLAPSDRRTAIELIDAAIDRSLWVVEGIRGNAPLSQERVAAVVSIREAVLHGAAELSIPQARIEGVWTRIAFAGEAPADLRGAALGALVSLGYLPAPAAAESAIRSFETAGPGELGDFLAGLLTVAREVLAAEDGIVSGLDDALAGLDTVEFQIALPSLRIAFQRLPARERAAFAARVAAIHGGDTRALTRRLELDADDVARARQIEHQVDILKEELGLDG
jgi:hypothetical protein